jgi:hypothetical protein
MGEKGRKIKRQIKKERISTSQEDWRDTPE